MQVENTFDIISKQAEKCFHLKYIILIIFLMYSLIWLMFELVGGVSGER